MPGTSVAGCLHALGLPRRRSTGAGRTRGRPGARAIVVNAGNANAFTGSAGVKTVKATAAAAAGCCRLRPEEVFIASTGVIGEPLPTPGPSPGACRACRGRSAADELGRRGPRRS